MHKTKILTTVAALFALLLPTHALAVNCCVQGVTPCVASPLSTHTTTLGNTPCGHTITTAGCEVVVDDDATITSGTCLTLGRGVKVTGNNHTITCQSGSTCGTGIAITQAGSGTTIINNINIVGGFSTGVDNTAFSNVAGQANYVDVDLQSVSGGVAGIDGFKNVNQSTVTGVNGGAGVVLHGGATLSGSLIRNSTIGITTTDYNNICDNSLIKDTGRWIMTPNGAYYTVDLRGSYFENATLCPCGKDTGGLCYYDMSYCSTIGGSDVSFFDNSIQE
jgi:hypothetical protein